MDRWASCRLGRACDPYLDYKCLDAYLGDDFFTRFFRYYQLEWGKGVAPSDPSAPPGRRSDAALAADSAVRAADAVYRMALRRHAEYRRDQAKFDRLSADGRAWQYQLGHAMNDAHIQVYGWVAPAAISAAIPSNRAATRRPLMTTRPTPFSSTRPCLYRAFGRHRAERSLRLGLPLSALYGVDYRYTTAYGLFSYQLLNHNHVNGFDFPMVYTDLYFPVLQGMDVRIGRFISVPDIEAQLAPNNYTYVHSLTYTFDNYTNTGIQVTTALTKNWICNSA
jgi:hypothetical protein